YLRRRLPSFFFPCYGAPPDLHSFPTRRSSDLPVAGLEARHECRPAIRQEKLVQIRSPALSSGEPRDLAVRRVDDHVLAAAEAARSEEPRLNSSHRTITYAVFCLKKKNNSPIHT